MDCTATESRLMQPHTRAQTKYMHVFARLIVLHLYRIQRERGERDNQTLTTPPPPPPPPPLRLTSSHIDGAAPRMMIITFLEYRIPKRKKKTSVGMKEREERTRRLSAGVKVGGGGG